MKYYRLELQKSPSSGAAISNIERIFFDLNMQDSVFAYYKQSLKINKTLTDKQFVEAKPSSNEFNFLPAGNSTDFKKNVGSLSSYIKNTGTSYTWFQGHTYYTKEQPLPRQFGVEIDDMNFTITYKSSLCNSNSVFGSGWSSNFESYINTRKSNLYDIVYHDESGKECIIRFLIQLLKRYSTPTQLRPASMTMEE